MIRTLTGTITEIGVGWVIITVHDVGYLVGSPTATTQFIENKTTTLHTHLAVRETALDLYGFTTRNELEVFSALLSVPKIGPKSALQVLNQASPALLVEAISQKDPSRLQKLTGIGKKTCENIVQFLHGKIDHLPEATETIASPLDQIQTDAIDALISLGYDMTTAREQVISIVTEDSTVNSLVTQALKRIK